MQQETTTTISTREYTVTYTVKNGDKVTTKKELFTNLKQARKFAHTTCMTPPNKFISLVNHNKVILPL